MLADLTRQFEGLKKHLYTDDGRLRSFVNVYVNDEDIRYLQKEQTPVKPGDTLSIVPSVAGGAPATRRTGELPTLTDDEYKRYSRHLIMPEVGVDGQRKLKAAQACSASAPAASVRRRRCISPRPASARIGIVDFDVVDVSNLQRQILHGTPDVGRSKLDVGQAIA